MLLKHVVPSKLTSITISSLDAQTGQLDEPSPVHLPPSQPQLHQVSQTSPFNTRNTQLVCL